MKAHEKRHKKSLWKMVKHIKRKIAFHSVCCAWRWRCRCQCRWWWGRLFCRCSPVFCCYYCCCVRLLYTRIHVDTHIYTNTHPHIHKSTTEGHWCTTKKSGQNNNEMYLNSAKRVPLSTQCSQRTHTRLYCSNCTPMPWESIGSSITKLYIRIISYQEGSLISCAQ